MPHPTEQTAPPRRKSCETCKKSKRRCDLAFPACSRCAGRDLQCVYPGRQPAICQDIVFPAIPPEETRNEIAPSFDTQTPLVADLDLMALTDTTSGGIPHPDLPHSHPGGQNPALLSSYVPVTEQSAELITSKRCLESLAGILATRLQFAIDVLKEAPRLMIIENQTPWCHRQLYKDGMPKIMQDAYACCSLYMSKNDLNSPVIRSIIDTHIANFLSAPPSPSPIESLAHTQALVLYLIMRLFDEDVRYRATTPSLIPVLESSVMSLFKYIHLPDPASPEHFDSSVPTIMDSWNSWIFQESARRTVLLTFYFIQVYRLLQLNANMVCDGRLGLVHSWYSSAHLWNAQSAFDFAVAWSEKEHFIVQNADFSGVLEHARPDDVDLFGRMLIVTVLGIDATKAWFYTRGAVL